MWNEAYAGEDYLYGKAPNAFLRARTPELKKGRALCLAAGEGRNAVHLASRGFSVTAVDASRVGLAKARSLALENGVTLTTVIADLADYRIEPGAWDTIISTFCHVPPDLRRRLHRGVVAGLTDGGTFLLEAYTPRQLEFGTGGPPSPELLMELETLREELEGLEILHGEELVRDVVEGTRHTGPGAVVQILARKPLNPEPLRRAVPVEKEL